MSYFFAVPSCLRRYFARSVINRQKERERRENKACSKTAGGHDLVQFKLELTPNHQSSTSKTPASNRLDISSSLCRIRASEKSDPEVSKVAFSLHDQCKIPDQRNLKNASPFESTHQCVSSFGLLNCQRLTNASKLCS